MTQEDAKEIVGKLSHQLVETNRLKNEAADCLRLAGVASTPWMLNPRELKPQPKS